MKHLTRKTPRWSGRGCPTNPASARYAIPRSARTVPVESSCDRGSPTGWPTAASRSGRSVRPAPEVEGRGGPTLTSLSSGVGTPWGHHRGFLETHGRGSPSPVCAELRGSSAVIHSPVENPVDNGYPQVCPHPVEKVIHRFVHSPHRLPVRRPGPNVGENLRLGVVSAVSVV